MIYGGSPNIDVIEHFVLRYLDAFDAHRFGLTQSRALKVIQRERERASEQTPDVETQYGRWFDDVDAKVTALVKNMCKECAEDPENEYAPDVQNKLKGINEDYWGDELWELITGTHHRGYELDLEHFAARMVEAHARN
tara:strand:+ start:71 stop:484 length:414 start_codon:yes stop_codon:yes gene_type:complete